jgi:aryl-alcohol dehydrogenase-like predicted oxidoreductase
VSKEPPTQRAETDVFSKTLYAKTEGADCLIIDRVGEVAKTREVPRAQVALAWLLQKSGVTAPIVGATKPEHLKDAVAAVGVKLSADEIATLERDYVPHTVAGFS